MTRTANLVCWAAAGAGALLVLAAAAEPKALAGVQPGLWEMDGAPGAARPVRRCIADVAALAQYEHGTRSCTRVVISDSGPTTTIHYTCTDGGFGRARMTVITPRSLRLELQGISSNFPFNYVLQARRVGNCPPH